MCISKTACFFVRELDILVDAVGWMPFSCTSKYTVTQVHC